MGKEANAATKLFEFAEDGMTEEFKAYFLEHPTEIRSFITMTAVYNRKLLHVACNKGNVEIATLLLDHLEKENLLSTIDELDQYRNSALYLCCVNGAEDENEDDEEAPARAEIVKLLISKGASILLFKGRNTPLHWACFHGDKDLINVILEIPESKQLLLQMNENGDFAIDLVKVNPKKTNEEKLELLMLLLERGDPNNANSAFTPKMKKIQNNHVAHVMYQPRDSTEEYPYRLLMWASHVGSEKDVELYLSKGYSPFVRTRKKRSALFEAAERGHTNLAKLFLKRVEKLEDREKLLSSSIDALQNTPLHAAIKHGKNETANYLFEAGSPPNIYNERGWLPHQMSRSTDKATVELKKKLIHTLNEKEKTGLALLGDFYTVRSRYQYCLIAKKGTDEKNLVGEQLKKIRRNALKEKRGQFHIAQFEGYENDNLSSGQKYLIYLIRIDDTLMNTEAQDLEIRMLNTKYRFLEKFDKSRKEEYEQFRAVTVQRMINYLLQLEFDVDLFLQQGILLDAFPIHDFTERSQISRTWKKENKLKKIIKWSDLLPHNEARIEHLRPLTACTFYYGTAVGWYLTFLSSLTTDLMLPGLAFLPFAILNRLWYKNDESAYIPYLSLIVAVWATLWTEKWKRRQSEMRFLWDLTEFETSQVLRPKYGGVFKIDGLTRKIIKEDTISEGTRRIIVETPLSIFGIGVILAIFYGFQHLEDWAAVHEDSGETSETIGTFRTFVNYVGAPVQGFCILAANNIYGYFATKAVEWENHKFESDRENSFVFKSFLFQFVNSYITLFYYAFINVNFGKVRSLLISFFVTKGLTQIGLTIILPYVIYRIKTKRLNKKMRMVLAGKNVDIEYIDKSRPDPELEEISSDEEDESKLENSSRRRSSKLSRSPPWSQNLKAENSRLDDKLEVGSIKIDGLSLKNDADLSNSNVLLIKKREIEAKFKSRENSVMEHPRDQENPQEYEESPDAKKLNEQTPGDAKNEEEDFLADDRKKKTKRDLLTQIEQQRSVMVLKRELSQEYSYLAIMFGYITMFSPAFPFGPLILLGTNWAKLQLDMWGLSTFTKRIYTEEIGSIGVWNTIFQLLAFVSIVVNGLFVLITSKTLSSSFPVHTKTADPSLYGSYRDLIVVVVAEHIIVILKFIIAEIIEDDPGWVQDATIERQYHQEKAIKERTASETKKKNEEMSEDMKFNKNMLKFLNDQTWLKKLISGSPVDQQNVVEVCQCITRVLKTHTHELKRKRDVAEYEDSGSQHLFERSSPFSSIDNGTKLMIQH